jgi:hypothetical protein
VLILPALHPPAYAINASTSDDATGVKKNQTPRAAKMWCRRHSMAPDVPDDVGTDWFCVRSTEVRVHDSASARTELLPNDNRKTYGECLRPCLTRLFAVVITKAGVASVLSSFTHRD